MKEKYADKTTGLSKKRLSADLTFALHQLRKVHKGVFNFGNSGASKTGSNRERRREDR